MAWYANIFLSYKTMLSRFASRTPTRSRPPTGRPVIDPNANFDDIEF